MMIGQEVPVAFKGTPVRRGLPYRVLLARSSVVFYSLRYFMFSDNSNEERCKREPGCSPSRLSMTKVDEDDVATQRKA